MIKAYDLRSALALLEGMSSQWIQMDVPVNLEAKFAGVERFFRRIKRFRRIFTRYDKLYGVFLAFVLFALIVDALM